MWKIETNNTRKGETGMFGLTEEEMNLYRDLAQDFAVEEVAHHIKGMSIFVAPYVQQGEDIIPDMDYLNRMLQDLEMIITLTATNMAYDYAHLQCETSLEEEEIIDRILKKYEDYVFQQFIKYGVAPTADVMHEVVVSIMLELPYLYSEVIEDENFDEDEFLEERLEAYTKYLDDNFQEEEEDEDEELDD